MQLKKLYITPKTVSILNQVYRTNIPVVSPNQAFVKAFYSDLKVPFHTKRQVIAVLQQLKKVDPSYLQVAIFRCGFDNGYPKNDRTIAQMIHKDIEYVYHILQKSRDIIQKTYLDPSIQVFSSAEEKEECEP